LITCANHGHIAMDTSYLPVQYVYREIIEEQTQKGTTGKVFYFLPDNTVECAEGKIVKLAEVQGEGEFITLYPEADIRIDRIITLFGKPGPAYDEYDAYANECLSCTGGYDLD
jgi:hypothetical protein